MKMDEVKGGVKVFSEGGDDADEEGIRVYSRLRRNQSDGGGGGSGASAGAGTAAAAKKRRNWKASEPVTAIGELRKSRSDVAAATGVVAKRAVARVTTPEKKVAEVKEVVVVEVPLQQPKNFGEEAEEDEEEWEEELEAEEEEKEVLDQDHMAIDDQETVQTTSLHQGKNYSSLIVYV
jgi:hypothetical protein